MKANNKRTGFFVVCIICIVAIIVMYITEIGCIFKYITGISCFGCGITRAYRSLLTGDIVQAFRYHPLFLVAPIIVVCMFDDIQPKVLRENKKLCKSIICVIAILFVLVYMLRLFVIKDAVVTINMSNSIVVKVFRYIKMHIF